MAKTFTIPSEITIKDKVIKVEFDDEYLSKHGLEGEANFKELKIRLCKTWRGHKLTKMQIEQTFFHELTHLLLHLCARHKLKWNEELVEELGLCLRDFYKNRK